MQQFKIGDYVKAGILMTGNWVEGEIVEIEGEFAKVKSFKDGSLKNIALIRCRKLEDKI